MTNQPGPAIRILTARQAGSLRTDDGVALAASYTPGWVDGRGQEPVGDVDRSGDERDRGNPAFAAPVGAPACQGPDRQRWPPYEPVLRWWLNLQAAGQAKVVVDGESRQVGYSIAHGSERDRLWQSFASMYPSIDDYVSITSRTLPLVVLAPLAEPTVGQDDRTPMTDRPATRHIDEPATPRGGLHDGDTV